MRTIILTLVLVLTSISVLPGTLHFSLVPAHATPSSAVTIVDYAFQPINENITTGTTVIWTYATNGADMHTVTSKNQTQGGTPLFASNTLHHGDSYNFTFNNPGRYAYYCAFHPSLMNAWINVTGAPINPPMTPPTSIPFAPIAIIAVVAIGIIAGIFVFLRRKRRANSQPKPSQTT